MTMIVEMQEWFQALTDDQQIAVAGVAVSIIISLVAFFASLASLRYTLRETRKQQAALSQQTREVEEQRAVDQAVVEVRALRHFHVKDDAGIPSQEGLNDLVDRINRVIDKLVAAEMHSQDTVRQPLQEARELVGGLHKLWSQIQPLLIESDTLSAKQVVKSERLEAILTQMKSRREADPQADLLPQGREALAIMQEGLEDSRFIATLVQHARDLERLFGQAEASVLEASQEATRTSRPLGSLEEAPVLRSRIRQAVRRLTGRQ